MSHLPRVPLLAVLGCAMLALTAHVTQAASDGSKAGPAAPTSCLLWAPVPTPDTGGHPWQVVAVNPARAWALSQAAPDRTNVLFWDGTTWTVRLTASLTTTFATTGANDAWVISRDQGVLHWNGVTWSLSLPGMLDGQIKAGGPNDVWVARNWNSGTGYTHWDGLHWTTIPDPPTGGSFITSAVGSPNQMWAGGGYNFPFAYYWDGTSWQLVPGSARSPNFWARGYYNSVQAAGSGLAWATGWQWFCDPTICTSWLLSKICTPEGCTHAEGPIGGTYGHAGNDLWWIGSDTETTSVTKHLTGGAWVDVPAANIGRLRSLSGYGPNDAWAVSATGSLHYDGTSWTLIPLSTGADTVMADGPTSAWAMGSGLIWHTVLGTVCPTATPTNTPTATPTPTNTPTPHPGQFQDVPPANTFYEYVECIGTRGIISGYPCGGPGEPCIPDNKPYFRPNNNLTRGQVSKIVVSAAGWNDPIPTTQQTFEDVPPGSTFWLWIEQLAGRGIIGGYPCGGPFEPCQSPGHRPYFRPNNNLTRGQFAKIDAGSAGYTATPTGQTFEDVAPASTFYAWVEQVAARGIVGGYPCGGAGEPCNPPGNRPYFRPNNNVTRGQAAKIVTNTFFPGCGSGTPTPTPTVVPPGPTATPTGPPPPATGPVSSTLTPNLTTLTKDRG